MCTIFFAGYRVRTLRKIYCRMFSGLFWHVLDII
jgi:hypothetical protein